MTNQQLYLSIGLPILVSLLNTGLLILYMNAKFEAVNAKFEALKETMNIRFKAIEDRLDKIEKRLDRLEEPRLIK